MLPGDIGKNIERELRRRWRDGLAANLLLAPHHGSLSSSSTAFIRAVEPDIVVFSAGYLNRFHHPQPRVLARYRGAGVQAYETAKTGALTFVIEAGVLRSVTEDRRRRAYYWH